MPQMDDIETLSGYVEVRSNAFMFWLLYKQDPNYAPNFLPPIDPVPLVIWLQVEICFI